MKRKVGKVIERLLLTFASIIGWMTILGFLAWFGNLISPIQALSATLIGLASIAVFIGLLTSVVLPKFARFGEFWLTTIFLSTLIFVVCTAAALLITHSFTEVFSLGHMRALAMIAGVVGLLGTFIFTISFRPAERSSNGNKCHF